MSVTASSERHSGELHIGDDLPIHVKARHLLASAVAAAVCALPAYAQYSGPSSIRQITVAEILKNPEAEVKLRSE